MDEGLGDKACQALASGEFKGAALSAHNAMIMLVILGHDKVEALENYGHLVAKLDQVWF